MTTKGIYVKWIWYKWFIVSWKFLKFVWGTKHVYCLIFLKFLVCAMQINNALQQHREQQAQECSKLSKHRRKYLINLEKYLGIFMDGMDQKKTCLPHFMRVSKDVKEKIYVHIHLVGCLLYRKKLQTKIFFNYPNYTMIQICQLQLFIASSLNGNVHF